MPELAGTVFIGLGIVVGFIAGETPSNMSKVFVEGCKKMLTLAMIIGLASAIASIMSAGKIVDTVVYALASCLRHTPSFFMAPCNVYCQYTDQLCNCIWQWTGGADHADHDPGI